MMWSKEFSHTGNRIVFFIGQFVLLIVCLISIDYVYTTSIQADKKASASFLKTQCFIVSKKLHMRHHFLAQYRADFLVRYQAKGGSYQGWVSGNGLDRSYFRNNAAQEDILTQYDVGGTYPCYYSPLDPQLLILVARHNWLGTFPIIAPSAIFLLLLYFFLKNLFILLRSPEIFKRG